MLAFHIGYADYSFDFYCRSDTVQQVNPYELGDFYFTITNTGTEPDVYEIFCQVVQEVPGWSAICCIKGRCVEPGVPMFDTLSPGASDTTLHLSVFTTNTQGEEVISLRVRSFGNHSLERTITTRTRMSGGVEEKSLANSTPVLPRTTIIAEPQNLTIYRKNGWVLVTAQGSRVGTVTLTAPGVFFVISKENNLLLKLIVVR